MEEPHSSKSIPNTDESIFCKGPCRKKTYASNLFLDHIRQAKRCRSKYTADQISDLELTKARREDTTVTLVSYIEVNNIIKL